MVEESTGAGCASTRPHPEPGPAENAELAHGPSTHEEAKFASRGTRGSSHVPTQTALPRSVAAGIVKGADFLMKKNKTTEIHGGGR